VITCDLPVTTVQFFLDLPARSKAKESIEIIICDIIAKTCPWKFYPLRFYSQWVRSTDIFSPLMIEEFAASEGTWTPWRLRVDAHPEKEVNGEDVSQSGRGQMWDTLDNLSAETVEHLVA
jgi:hypothetical protein